MQRGNVAERHHVALGYGRVIDADTPFRPSQTGRIRIRRSSGGRRQRQEHDQRQVQTPAQQAQERQGAGSERPRTHNGSVTLELNSRLEHGV